MVKVEPPVFNILDHPLTQSFLETDTCTSLTRGAGTKCKVTTKNEANGTRQDVQYGGKQRNMLGVVFRVRCSRYLWTESVACLPRAQWFATSQIFNYELHFRQHDQRQNARVSDALNIYKCAETNSQARQSNQTRCFDNHRIIDDGFQDGGKIGIKEKNHWMHWSCLKNYKRPLSGHHLSGGGVKRWW